MKVLGQLEVAQLEQIAAATTLPAARGRIYIDITNPALGIARLHNGTEWKQLAYTSDIGVVAFVSQNSGKSVTVDWSAALVQQVILTDNAIISFSNPQENQVHRLIVTQKTYDSGSQVIYQYKLNLPDQVLDENEQDFEKLGTLKYQMSTVYSWVYKAGIGAAYATVPATLPSQVLASAVTGVGVHPKGTLITVGQAASPFQSTVRAYDQGHKFFMSAINVTTPATAAARVVGTAFSPGGGLVSIASGTSPFIQTWNLDAIDGPTGTAFANPATLPTGAGQCIAFHPSGSYVAIGHTNSPFMSVYPISTGGYGLKLANPATLPVAQVNAIAFSPHGDFLAVASQTTPFIQVWPFDALAGTIGAVVANPSVLPAGGPPGSIGKGIAWHPMGTFIAHASTVAPQLNVYAFDRATASFGANQNATLTSLNTVQFSLDGNFLFAGGTLPTLTCYDFSAQTIGGGGLVFDAPGAPVPVVNDLSMHPNGKLVIVGLASSPGVQVFPLPTKVRNYVRL